MFDDGRPEPLALPGGAVTADSLAPPPYAKLKPDAGRRRCYYRLTPAGKAELEANLLTWGEIARGMKLVLGGGGANLA